MRFVSALLFVLLLVAASLPAAEPQWIWSTKDAATKGEAGSVYFRKTFTLEEPQSGSVEITADNSFELFLNGRRVGTGDSWNKRYQFNLTPLLLPGRNVIGIAASNGGPDPAGVAAKFVLQGKGKEPAELLTDNTWKFHLKPQGTWARIESDDSQWETAFALGEYGKAAPWGAAGPVVVGASETVLNKPRSREKGLFDFRDGDRVVFLGSAFIERLQNTGYLETMLTAAMPSKNITFRNLGWSGDTVWGDARAVFGTRADGFKRLIADVALCDPTVLIVCYGENEAFAGEAGLDEFRAGLNTLLDSLEATGARIVLLGPRQHENVGPPLPDPAKYNADLRKYNDVIGDVAKEREHTFVDMYESATGIESDSSMTNTINGIHLHPLGDWRISKFLCQALGASLRNPRISVDFLTGSFDATDTMVERFARQPNGSFLMEFHDRALFIPRAPQSSKSDLKGTWRDLELRNKPPGLYELRVNDKLSETMESRTLTNPTTSGRSFLDQNSQENIDVLRQLINEKNTLFFHRYRPQNETYLFLFRKHEQGNNAVEIPQFDPLIAELEKKIAQLKKPVKQTYELIKVK